MTEYSPWDELSKEAMLKLTIKCYVEAAVKEAWEIGWHMCAEVDGCEKKPFFEHMCVSLEAYGTGPARCARLIHRLKDLDLLNLKEVKEND